MESNVIIKMDEIHVKSTFTYKCDKIFGSSLNPIDPAKTVFALWSLVCVENGQRLFAYFLYKLPATKLLQIIKSVIEGVESLDL